MTIITNLSYFQVLFSIFFYCQFACRKNNLHIRLNHILAEPLNSMTSNLNTCSNMYDALHRYDFTSHRSLLFAYLSHIAFSFFFQYTNVTLSFDQLQSWYTRVSYSKKTHYPIMFTLFFTIFQSQMKCNYLNSSNYNIIVLYNTAYQKLPKMPYI